MLISSVDLAMVGSLGSRAISATGIISQPRMMILCLSRSIGVAVTTFFVIIFILGRMQILELFSFKGEALFVGANVMIIMAIACFVIVDAMIISGVLRGAGDTKYLAAYSIGVIAIFRPILTWILCFALGMGVYGAWISLAIDQSLRMYFANRRFKNRKWKYIEI